MADREKGAGGSRGVAALGGIGFHFKENEKGGAVPIFPPPLHVNLLQRITKGRGQLRTALEMSLSPPSFGGEAVSPSQTIVFLEEGFLKQGEAVAKLSFMGGPQDQIRSLPLILRVQGPYSRQTEITLPISIN